MRTIRILLASLLAAAVVAVVAPGAGADSASLTNSDGILIPATGTSGESAPYPSSIDVADVGGTITDVEVTLTGLSHTWPSIDLEIFLEAPSGETVVLFSDCGNSAGAVDVNLQFVDGAPALQRGPELVSGQYSPTACQAPSAGSPAGPHGTTLSTFDGLTPNGDWDLYVYDSAFGDTGDLDAWSIDIETTNTAPSTEDLAFETAEDTPLVVDAGTGLAAGTTDPDDTDDIDFEVTDGPDNGTLDLDLDTGAFTYTPDADFNGVDTFTYLADDNVPDLPVLVLSDTVTVYEASTAPADEGDKSDGDSGTKGSPPATYEVAREASGVRAAAVSGPSTVTITVQPLNDPPVAVDDEAATTSGTSVTIDAVANDTDVDGDTLEVDSVSAAVNGTVTFDGGEVTYVPNDDFVGTEVLTYEVTDGTATDEGTITITVTAEDVGDDGATASTTTTTTVATGSGTLPKTGANGGPLGEYGMFAVFLVLSGMSFAAAGSLRRRMLFPGRHLDV